MSFASRIHLVIAGRQLNLVSFADGTEVRGTSFFQVSVNRLRSQGALLAFGKSPLVQDNGTCSVPSIRLVWFAASQLTSLRADSWPLTLGLKAKATRFARSFWPAFSPR